MRCACATVCGNAFSAAAHALIMFRAKVGDNGVRVAFFAGKNTGGYGLYGLRPSVLYWMMHGHWLCYISGISLKLQPPPSPPRPCSFQSFNVFFLSTLRMSRRRLRKRLQLSSTRTSGGYRLWRKKQSTMRTSGWGKPARTRQTLEEGGRNPL